LQEANETEILSARSSGFAASVSNSYQSVVEKGIVRIDNTIDIVKKILIIPVIVFGIFQYIFIILP
jgi:hypothetical protein